jgi:ABC-type nitrate/sulfonate/bicarbonate transport system substrate-binding protein
MSEKDIIPVFLESAKLEEALVDGSVDAIAVTDNIARSAMKKLGDKGMLLEEPGLCLIHTCLVTSKKYAASYPERVDSFLRALRAAELFRLQNQDKSREIVMASLKLSREEHDTILGKFNVRLALDNALLLTLEEHATWVIQKGIIAKQPIPNYLNFIDASHLQKTVPESVRLKR